MKENPVVELEGISKAFSGVPVLKGISCSFEKGKVHCLLGENGAGKSTLIKIISGAYTADDGEIQINGSPAQGYSPLWARRNGINTIYQEIDLVPNLSVAENIVLGNEPRRSFGRVDKVKSVAESKRILLDMGVDIDPLIEVQELPLAQQQMVAIAKALSTETSLIILDEPTAVFTRRETERLFALVRQLTAEGKAVVFISHHLDEVFEIGDWVTVLRDGVVVSSGPIEEYDHDRLVRDMVGREIVPQRHPASETLGPKMLEVSHLTDGAIVSDATFDVRSGEIVCLAGLVGAGRSETVSMIVGASPRAGGSVLLNGKPFSPKSPSQALASGVALLPEDRKRDGLALGRSSSDNMSLSLVQRTKRLGVVAWGKMRQQVEAHMKLLNVDPPDLHKAANLFSGGNQQKLVLARLMMANPDLLILDEPTRGVDIGARQQIYATIRKLRDEGRAILVVSSDLEEVLSISDRILVMARGKVAGELDAQEANEENVMRLAFSVEKPQRIRA